MTDRVNALTVILEQDTRTDDIEPLIDAILHLRGILRVETHVRTSEAYIAENRAKRDLRDKLFEILND